MATEKDWPSKSQRLRAKRRSIFASALSNTLHLGLIAGVATSPLNAAGSDAIARHAMVKRIEKIVRSRAPAADDAQLKRVLAALARVSREQFARPEDRQQAYDDTPLPIGYDQTLSAAYTVAIMTAAANLSDHARVLDVGTGSGYQAAVLAELGAQVTSIEIIAPLAAGARQRLSAMGYRDIDVRTGDGYAGALDRAPFDAIIVAAGAATVPQPLLDQVRIGGRIIMPIGATWATEQLLVITKTGEKTADRCSLGWTMFVPLTGRGARRPEAVGLLDRTIRDCYAQAIVSPTFVPRTGRSDETP